MRRSRKTMARGTGAQRCYAIRPKLGRQRAQLPPATLRKLIPGAPIRTPPEGLLSSGLGPNVAQSRCGHESGTYGHLEEYVSQGEQPTQQLRDEVCLPMRDPVNTSWRSRPLVTGPVR